MSPTASVIVPCWEQSRYLSDSIGSLRKQTFDNFEIIIVGDHEACCYADECGLKSVLDPGYGVSFARNLGIDEAEGRFICCLDADDALAPTYLEKTVALAMRAPTDRKLDSRVMVRTHMQEFGERQGEWILPEYSKKVQPEFNSFTCATLFSKSLWAEAGGFDCEMVGYEDFSTFCKFCSFDPDVYTVPEKLLLYRTGPNQSTPGKQHLDATLKAMIYFKHVDMFHPNPTRYFDAIKTISMMDDDCYRRVNKRLSQLPHLHNLRLFSMLAHQYRNGHPKTNEPSTHAYPISLFTR